MKTYSLKSPAIVRQSLKPRMTGATAREPQSQTGYGPQSKLCPPSGPCTPRELVCDYGREFSSDVRSLVEGLGVDLNVRRTRVGLAVEKVFCDLAGLGGDNDDV